MKQVVYTELSGRIYSFGEFFPVSIIPFAYNETVAQEYFPLEKNKAVSLGYSWKEEDSRSYSITIPSEKIPEISYVSQDICKEIIGCVDGTGFFSC